MPITRELASPFARAVLLDDADRLRSSLHARSAACLLQSGSPMQLHRSEIAPHLLVSQPRCGASCPSPGRACSFQVAWSINPHMRVGAVETTRAARQHSTFLHTLRSLGVTVEAMPFVHGAFDSVFAKDNAVVVEREDGRREALLAHPRHAERRSEQRARAEALSRMAIRVVDVAEAPLEGGDVVMLPGGRHALLGHGFRSSTSAVRDLERFLDGNVTLVELRDPLLYHLDMAVSVLADGTALVCADALTDAGLRAVERHPLVNALIVLDRSEALKFGANLVQVGSTIVWAADAPQATEALARRGYHVRRVELDQFHLAGGSAACLVSRIHSQRTAPNVFGDASMFINDEAPPPSVAA